MAVELIDTSPKLRGMTRTSHDPSVLTEVYREHTNLLIWQRQLAESLSLGAKHILSTQPTLRASCIVNADNVQQTLAEVLGSEPETFDLREDISLLVDMFCCLFDLQQVGLRLTSLNRAMCPRFHVDKVPCRLVTTYQGIATEWVPHHIADRTKLGAGSQGKTDEESGLMPSANDIQILKQGDVALLKGERWEGNEGAGVIHRSPQMSNNESRLLLTLDFMTD